MTTRQQAADSVEDALRAQHAVYAERDDPETRARGDRMILTSWVGISSWSGVDDDGTDTSRLVLHLRDGQLPTWQIIGPLRAMLLQMEATYTGIGLRDED